MPLVCLNPNQFVYTKSESLCLFLLHFTPAVIISEVKDKDMREQDAICDSSHLLGQEDAKETVQKQRGAFLKRKLSVEMHLFCQLNCCMNLRLGQLECSCNSFIGKTIMQRFFW